MLVFVTAVVYASFPVYPDEGDGEDSEYTTGNATTDCDFTDWDNRYPYMVDGEGDLDSGSGMGYFTTDVSWFTSANEVENATEAHFIFEVEYAESGDATGKSNAYLYTSFRVYKKSGSSWNLVGQDTETIYNDLSDQTHSYKVSHNFDDSQYKYRFIQKVYFDEPDIYSTLASEVSDEDQQSTGARLYVDN